ncbi:hypothetical protein [Ottowia testudinis]|uniref:Uncharacterized protein n=1 Tax=Ottowia testudinis TaxID=2816950 RepID=A0A975CGW9_9BURK|nr:hypothetical protein [Ottowia testudinis]QTD45985.1 hypothetical protein J1M35_03475 [Ottowia testudinis]
MADKERDSQPETVVEKRRGKGISHHFRWEGFWMMAPLLFVVVMAMIAGLLAPWLLR